MGRHCSTFWVWHVPKAGSAWWHCGISRSLGVQLELLHKPISWYLSLLRLIFISGQKRTSGDTYSVVTLIQLPTHGWRNIRKARAKSLIW